MALFISRGVNLRVVRKTAQQSFSAGGHFEVVPEVVISFAPGGTYETDDQDEIEFLRSRPSFNTEFFERGNEPDAQKPSVDDQLADILRLATDFDRDGLESLLSGESAKHNREVVVNAAKTAITNIERAHDEEAAKLAAA